MSIECDYRFRRWEQELFCASLQRTLQTEPLTRDQERTANRDTLIQANTRYAYTVAQRYAGKLPLDDAVSTAYLGLCVAADRFDPARGFRFITYAVWWMRQAIIAEIDKCRDSQRSLDLDAPSEDGHTLAETVTYPEGQGPASPEWDDMPECVRQAVAHLPPRYQEILVRYYGIGRDPQTLQEIGTDLGVSKQRISQMRFGALARLRRHKLLRDLANIR